MPVKPEARNGLAVTVKPKTVNTRTENLEGQDLTTLTRTGTGRKATGPPPTAPNRDTLSRRGKSVDVYVCVYKYKYIYIYTQCLFIYADHKGSLSSLGVRRALAEPGRGRTSGAQAQGPLSQCNHAAMPGLCKVSDRM